jgi:hypothetical protein
MGSIHSATCWGKLYSFHSSRQASNIMEEECSLIIQIKRTGFTLDPNGDSFNEVLSGICNDCMFLSGSTYATYEDGSRADISTGVYNHHIAVVDVGKTNIAPFDCKWNMTALLEGMASGYLASAATMGGAKPAGGMGHGKGRRRVTNNPMKRSSGSYGVQSLAKRQIGLPGTPVSQIFGSGDDGSAQSYFSMDPSLKAGYYIGKNDFILHTSELINYINTSQKVYITADVEYIPGKPKGWSDAVMGAVSAVGCMPFGYCKCQLVNLWEI